MAVWQPHCNTLSERLDRNRLEQVGGACRSQPNPTASALRGDAEGRRYSAASDLGFDSGAGVIGNLIVPRMSPFAPKFLETFMPASVLEIPEALIPLENVVPVRKPRRETNPAEKAPASRPAASVPRHYRLCAMTTLSKACLSLFLNRLVPRENNADLRERVPPDSTVVLIKCFRTRTHSVAKAVPAASPFLGTVCFSQRADAPADGRSISRKPVLKGLFRTWLLSRLIAP
jgi:hypothetical protein